MIIVNLYYQRGFFVRCCRADIFHLINKTRVENPSISEYLQDGNKLKNIFFY